MAHESVQKMWEAYLHGIGEMERGALTFEAWHFCDNQEDADALAQLVLDGTKRGTASLVRAYEIENEPLPKKGDLSMITDFGGAAKCIIQTVDIAVYPFDEVPESFAQREGEGDKSLRYWKAAHEAAFTRELQTYGEAFAPSMRVVCESFEVVYPPVRRM